MLTISDSIKVTPEIKSITSIQEAFEGNTLKCAYCAVGSTLEIWLVVLVLDRVAQTKVPQVSGALVWFAVVLANYIKLAILPVL